MGYHRYQLTYPYEGTRVHRTRSFDKAVKKCYSEFKRINDISDGMFSVTNLDNDTEYQFKVEQNKIYNLRKQKGGVKPTNLAKPQPLIKPNISSKVKILEQEEEGSAPKKEDFPDTVKLDLESIKESERETRQEESRLLTDLDNEVDEFEGGLPGHVDDDNVSKIQGRITDIESSLKRIESIVSKPPLPPIKEVIHVPAPVPKKEPEKPPVKKYESGGIVNRTLRELEIISSEKNEYYSEWCSIM